MSDLIQEIQQHFAAGNKGLRPLRTLPKDSPAYTFRGSNDFGVAISCKKGLIVYEEASNITISTRDFPLGDETQSFLLLTCCDEAYRNEFADLCSHFVEPGESNNNRLILSETPLTWWGHWVGMLGNRVSSRKSYDTIAEMLALEELYSIDKSIKWTASQAGSHDIESDEASYEIKSTILKSGTNVSISSQFQLASEKKLQLWFFRLEASELGVSINDMVERLIAAGYDANLIESQIEKRGFVKGSSIRDKKFVLLEKRKYLLN